ncbi:histone deacetylase [Streptacidiphilus sp. P02-A3a]|uniref:histone deacetylase n=1 Tax=Streptacidiphilus sp. P02-A3a TaxID=2704468 RepID=UPI001CDC21AB|nr:histone deacetylase [Streptacidiphilus sp. P02-A3a]
MPERAVGVVLPGRLYFAGESAVWGGGMGFYDPLDAGWMPARAYLVTVSQFADIAAQEMHRETGPEPGPETEPETGLDLRAVLAEGRAVLGPGRYETLVSPGTLAGRPVLTFTASGRSAGAALARPSAGYLRQLAAGLGEGQGWDVDRAAGYLASRPGARGAWTAAELAAALQGDAGGDGLGW